MDRWIDSAFVNRSRALPRVALVCLGICLLGIAIVFTVGRAEAATQESSAAAQASVPCGAVASPTERTVAITDQGLTRPFALYLPSGTPPKLGLPLVLNLHGSGSNGDQQMTYTDMQAAADRRGVAVAAPNGAVPLGTVGYAWNVPGVPLVSGAPVPDGTPDDERYLLHVIRAAEQAVCVNQKRVFITGMSGGGRMASQMACDFAGKIAAIAPVSSLRAGVPVKRADGSWAPTGSSCRPDRPVPIVSFHGTADATNPYLGNDDPRWGYSAVAALKQWAKIDGCKQHNATEAVTPTVDRLAFGKCRGESSVSLYREEGAGHTWPGSSIQLGVTDESISATTTILKFFSRHPLEKKTNSVKGRTL